MTNVQVQLKSKIQTALWYVYIFKHKSVIIKYKQPSYFSAQDTETPLTGKTTMSSPQSPQYIYIQYI